VHPAAAATKRRRVGLFLLLAGLALAAGGFALPWLSVTCVAGCSNDYPLAPTRGPIADYGLASFIICPPVGALMLTFALLTVLQEFLPAEGRFAAPFLLLAGMLLFVQAIVFELLGITVGRGPELTLGLLPGGAVAPVGALLVGAGGWLRYHPRQSETPRVLAEVPAER
jgi:hypothetical protein